MAKHKQAVDPLAELHFISAIQLEEAVAVMERLASQTTPITLTELSEDEWQFEIWYYRRQLSAEAYVKGTLRRWQGTYTRLDCNGEVQRTIVQNPTPDHFEQNLLAAALSLFGFLLIFGGSLFGVLVFIVAMLVWNGQLGSRWEERTDDHTITRVQFRERDHLLQLLIRGFQMVGRVSYDGSDLEDGELVQVRRLQT